MDLATIETKINSGAYTTPEDFELDVNLIFQNCEAYNGPKKNTPLVTLAKFCAKTFKRIYAKKMEDLQAGIGADGKRSLASPEGQPTSKRIKLDLSAVPKAAPRISITASKVADASARSTSTKPQETSSPPKKLDEPVPLHVAIAQIKESFPLRRPAKMLEGWEAACWRFFRELMKHPWLSAARPKFIYSVPVPVLFPSLRDAYAELIKNPMDLTTAEAKLLSGGMYLSAQEFVNDVALVFANAIIFNHDGHDEGDPTSCAYFDASRHLLRYTRWLSIEYLSDFLANDAHVDPPTGKDELVTSWKLTTGNRKVAREEMENIALKTPMDVSNEVRAICRRPPSWLLGTSTCLVTHLIVIFFHSIAMTLLLLTAERRGRAVHVYGVRERQAAQIPSPSIRCQVYVLFYPASIPSRLQRFYLHAE